jgi:hypothetical protein
MSKADDDDTGKWDKAGVLVRPRSPRSTRRTAGRRRCACATRSPNPRPDRAAVGRARRGREGQRRPGQRAGRRREGRRPLAAARRVQGCSGHGRPARCARLRGCAQVEGTPPVRRAVAALPAHTHTIGASISSSRAPSASTTRRARGPPSFSPRAPRRTSSSTRSRPRRSSRWARGRRRWQSASPRSSSRGLRRSPSRSRRLVAHHRPWHVVQEDRPGDLTFYLFTAPPPATPPTPCTWRCRTASGMACGPESSPRGAGRRCRTTVRPRPR